MFGKKTIVTPELHSEALKFARDTISLGLDPAAVIAAAKLFEAYVLEEDSLPALEEDLA